MGRVLSQVPAHLSTVPRCASPMAVNLNEHQNACKPMGPVPSQDSLLKLQSILVMLNPVKPAVVSERPCLTGQLS